MSLAAPHAAVPIYRRLRVGSANLPIRAAEGNGHRFENPTFWTQLRSVQVTMEVATRITLLANRFHSGDSAALDELLTELRPLVVQVARLVVGSGSSAAEDAAQEALIDVSRGLSGLRDPAAVRTWALRIATRRAIKVARRERLLRVSRSESFEGLQVQAPEDGRQAALKQAFDRLSPRLRATAVLRLKAGLSEEETANALDCSVGAVKSNLHDARKRLAEALTEMGYAPTVQKGREPS